MLSHRNIIANCRGAYHLLKVFGLEDETFLSFLPLSHSYEHSAGLMFPISIGAQIYFADSAETLAHDLLAARPTLMSASYSAFCLIGPLRSVASSCMGIACRSPIGSLIQFSTSWCGTRYGRGSAAA